MLAGMEKAAATVKAIAERKGITVPTAREQKLMAAALEVRSEPPIKTFLASQLVQCTLPHSDPGQIEWWTRTTGNLTLGIRTGSDPISQKWIGIPYGVIPRLLLFWINTEATRMRSRRLELGTNLSEFMEALELDPESRGPRSDAKRLREQMRRLFRATINFTYRRSDDRTMWRDMQVAEAGSDDTFQWWDHLRPGQSSLWTEYIELGERFYDCITKSPVPTNMRALRALRNSSLLLDLYSWSTHRAYFARSRGEVQEVTWSELGRQLGAQYSNRDEFARKTRQAIQKIKSVYPGLIFRFERGGLLILPESESEPAIPE